MPGGHAAPPGDDETTQLCREIEGLLEFRQLIHTSEGFDREDEKVLTAAIQQKREALGDRAVAVQGVIDRFEKRRIDDAIAHMEVQLSNRIKVLEMGEKQFHLAEPRCPEMYQYFIRKQVVLLKKLNAIKKSLNIDPNHTIHRTPGASIRERHPDQKVPLPRQKIVHADADGASAPPADDAPVKGVDNTPRGGADEDQLASMLLQALDDST